MLRFSTFLRESRRRHVWRAGVVYLLTAFAVAEVADLVFPRLGLPEWTVTLVIVLAILGFPIALVLAWAFELTPEGVQRAEPSTGEPPGPGRRPVTGLVYPAAAALVLVAAYLLLGRGETAEPSDSTLRALAVLPFANLTPDAESEYFADGMTEELIVALGRVEGLRIVSRTSAFAFKGRGADVREVGEVLGVGAILEGSVRTADERLRVAVRLVDARDGYQLWSGTYDRASADIFDVQEEIARSVVATLAERLAPEDGPPVAGDAHLARRGTRDLEAYDLYLQGRFFVNKWSEGDVRRGLEYFERAIERDSSFARAWAGLAQAYVSLPYYVDDGEAVSKATAAARRALDLDESLSEPHGAIAQIASEYEWDWPTAEREFRRALELDPSNGAARHRYAHLLVVLGRDADATYESRRLLELDPVNPQWHHHLGWHYFHIRRFELAEAPFRKAIDLDPHLHFDRGLGVLYIMQGRLEEGVAELEEAIERRGATAETMANLAWGYATAGDMDAARRVLAGMSERGIVAPPWRKVYVHAALGEIDRAFEWLERTAAERGPVFDLVRDPRIDPLRDDPRFRDLVRRMNLPG